MPFILQVALDTPLHRLFDYRLPEQLGPVQTGSLVEVPFGRTLQIGVALERQSDSAIVADTLRDVIRVLDDRPAQTHNNHQQTQKSTDKNHKPQDANQHATLPPRLRNASPFAADTP